MENDKKQLARDLFFQTNLSKTQIATMLGISRRSITYWTREGDWNRLKESANHLPSLIAEKCYHIMGHLTDDYLSERRITERVSHKEIDGLYKLTLTINKLKNRSTMNESMEMFGFFMDGLRRRDAGMAAGITPYIEEFIASRASIYAADLKPAHFNGVNDRIPWVDEDKTEEYFDKTEDYFSDPVIVKAYADAGVPLPTDEEMYTPPPQTVDYPVKTRAEILEEHNKIRQEAYDKYKAGLELEKSELLSEPVENCTRKPVAVSAQPPANNVEGDTMPGDPHCEAQSSLTPAPDPIPAGASSTVDDEIAERYHKWEQEHDYLWLSNGLSEEERARRAALLSLVPVSNPPTPEEKE